MRAATARHMAAVSANARWAFPIDTTRATRSTASRLDGRAGEGTVPAAGATTATFGTAALVRAASPGPSEAHPTAAAARIASSRASSPGPASSASGRSVPPGRGPCARTKTIGFVASTSEARGAEAGDLESVLRRGRWAGAGRCTAPPGSRKSSAIRAPVPGTPGSTKSPRDRGLAGFHRHAGVDELPGVRVVDAHDGHGLVGGDEPLVDGEGADRRGDVAAVAAVVDERPRDLDLGERVVDVRVRAGRSARPPRPWTARRCRRPARRAGGRPGRGSRARRGRSASQAPRLAGRSRSVEDEGPARAAAHEDGPDPALHQAADSAEGAGVGQAPPGEQDGALAVGEDAASRDAPAGRLVLDDELARGEPGRDVGDPEPVAGGDGVVVGRVGELERQHAPVDQVGAVDAREALGDDPAHAEVHRARSRRPRATSPGRRSGPATMKPPPAARARATNSGSTFLNVNSAIAGMFERKTRTWEPDGRDVIGRDLVAELDEDRAGDRARRRAGGRWAPRGCSGPSRPARRAPSGDGGMRPGRGRGEAGREDDLGRRRRAAAGSVITPRIAETQAVCVDER